MENDQEETLPGTPTSKLFAGVLAEFGDRIDRRLDAKFDGVEGRIAAAVVGAVMTVLSDQLRPLQFMVESHTGRFVGVETKLATLEDKCTALEARCFELERRLARDTMVPPPPSVLPGESHVR